jgi:multidrug efflux pump subunit AcrB
MRLPRIAADLPQFTIVVFIMLAWFGVNSYLTMPRTENPEIVVPGTLVIAVLPGAAPSDMETLVADPVERAVNELDYINRVTTRITEGYSITSIEFDFETDADRKYDEVVQKVNSIRGELPDELYSLETWKWSTTDIVTLQLALVSESASWEEIEHHADLLKRAAEKSEGVKKVKVHGIPSREVAINLDFARMAAMNISLEQVENAIASNNMTIPAGTIDIAGSGFNVRGTGRYSSPEEIANTVVSSYAGRLIRIADIATVSIGRKDPDYIARFNGKRSAFITITQKSGRNVFDVNSRLRTNIGSIASGLPQDISLDYVFDQTEGVSDRLNKFTGSLLQGIILVGLIIFLAIGVRSALVVIMAIPLSVISGIGIIDFAGFGLQQISIAGLVISLGMLVDNSIVMVENISRHIAKGLTPREASVTAASEIGWPVVTATITTLLAFIPIAMMPDKAGEFIKSLPVTIMATLTVSLLAALTLTPVITSRLFRPADPDKPKKGTPFRRFLNYIIENPYRQTLSFALTHRWLTVAIATGIFLGTLALVPGVGISFFPKAEQPNFLVTVKTPQGTAIEKTDSLCRVVESILNTIPGVRFTASNTGHGNPQIYYNIYPERNNPSLAQIYVRLDGYTPDGFAETVQRTRDAVSDIAGAMISVREFEQGPPVSAPVHIYISGKDIEVLAAIASEIEKIVREHPGATNVTNSASGTGTSLFVDINRDKANMYGVPVHLVSKAVRASVAGLRVSAYRDESGEEYDIVLKNNSSGSGMEVFEHVHVASLAERQIPLLHLADLTLKDFPLEINHYGMERTVQIKAYNLPGYTVDEIVTPAMDRLREMKIPQGYSWHVAGEIEGRKEAFGGMENALLIAVLAILAVLVLQFRSWKQPLIIFIAVPFAVTGMIWALFLTGNTFSFTAFIGLISLVGIVVNNSIILVDYTNRLKAEGRECTEALQAAGEIRFTPIVLTALTTIGGLLPLTLGGGTLWAPLGWTIIGGLLVSTFLTLIVVPVIYKILS